MKRNLTMAVIAFSFVAIMAGCAGKMGRTNYYTLNLPAPPDPPAAGSAHTTVSIREFRAPAYLKQGAIVYKPSPEQIGFYAYHRWPLTHVRLLPTRSSLALAPQVPFPA